MINLYWAAFKKTVNDVAESSSVQLRYKLKSFLEELMLILGIVAGFSGISCLAIAAIYWARIQMGLASSIHIAATTFSAAILGIVFIFVVTMFIHEKIQNFIQKLNYNIFLERQELIKKGK